MRLASFSTSMWLGLLALTVGCNEPGGSVPTGYLADTPLDWISAPPDDPGGDGDDWDDGETSTRPIVPLEWNRFSRLETQEGEVRYALTRLGGLTVSRPGEDTRNVRFAADPFHVSVDGGVAHVWTFESPMPGSVSRLEPVDARAVELARGTALEVPGTIQFVDRDGDSMLVASVEDDSEGHSVTWVHVVDLADPLVPVIAQSLQLETDVTMNSGTRDFHRRGDRLYVSTGIDRVSTQLDVLAVDGQTATLADSLSLDGTLARGGIDQTAAGVLRMLLQQDEGVTALLTHRADDLTEVGRVELGRDDTVSWAFGPQGVHFVDGREGMTARTTLTEVFVEPSPIELPGRDGQLLSFEGDAALYQRAVDNPGGGTHLALSLVDFEGQDAGEAVEIEGDWAFAGAPAFDAESQTFALPTSQQWFQDPRVCPDTTSTEGVQLLSRNGTDLTRTGFIETDAPVVSTLWQDGLLIVRTSVRDLTFDVRDPTAPVLRSSVTTTVFAEQLTVTDGAVARLYTDNYATQFVELLPTDAPTRPDPVGRLELPPPTLPGWDPCDSISHWTDAMLGRGDALYVSRYLVNAGTGAGVRSISIIDVPDPTAPASVAELALPTYRYGLELEIRDRSQDVVLVGDRLVVATYTAPEFELRDDGGRIPRATAQLHVFDLADPSNPVLLATFDRMDAMAHGKLVVRDDRVVSWAAVAANEDATRMHVYAESFDVAGTPSQEEPQNLPGIPLAVDADGDMLVVDMRVVDSTLSKGECLGNEYTWNSAEGRCNAQHEALAKVAQLEDAVTIVGEAALSGALEATMFRTSDARVFAVLGFGSEPQSITAIDWAPDAPAVSDPIALPGDPSLAIEALALGTRALVTWGGGYAVVDATDALAPEVTVHDRAASGCVDLQVSDSGEGLCAGGQWGVEALPL